VAIPGFAPECRPESKYPVIVTTSRLLSTGVDAQTCRLIVLAREVGSMTEFKLIVGRGTRVHEDSRPPRRHCRSPFVPALAARSLPSGDEAIPRRKAPPFICLAVDWTQSNFLPRYYAAGMKTPPVLKGQNQFLLYTAPDGAVKVDVFFKDETAWLTQRALAELFAVKVPAVNKHLKNIFESGELSREATISKMEIVRGEGGRSVARGVEFYNLDAIIAVGYRVNSHQATQFRIWATRTLREFIVKGFVLDDERLKQGKHVFGKDYFDELLERIREIRASERRFYQKITDIYALSSDYNAEAPLTKEFFASVQNKLHWAITGQTAAELIYTAADASRLYMGLTTWKHAPRGKILKSDVLVAKNYLSEAHVKEAESDRLRVPRPGREPCGTGHRDA
jgi:hypothetical protein